MVASPITSNGTATGDPILTVGDIRGLEATLLVLKEFAPDLYRELNAEMREVMREVSDGAVVRFPVKSGAGLSGFRVKKSRASIGYTAINDAKSAVITEFAGKVNPGGVKPRGARLIASLNASYGGPGRFLWQSWEERRDAALERIKARAAELEAEYNARLRGAPVVI